MNKAQSISINTIVVAAIALVVMILIVMIFTGNMNRWRQSTDACSSNGGTCEPEDPYTEGYENCQGTYDRPLTQYSDSCGNNKICCLHG